MSARPAWMTPDLAYKAVGMIVLACGLYWGIVHKVDALGGSVRSTNDKVVELSDSIKEIRQSLPNREADKLVVQALADRTTKLESDMEKMTTYMINLRERLASSGWRP